MTKKTPKTALPHLLTSGGGGGQNTQDEPDRLILRPHAAKIIGTSVPSLRRLETAGILKPIIVDEKNVHWHSLRQVQDYAAQMKALAAPADSVDGAIAAAAFELLDGGADAADLVRSLKIPPSAARALQSEWADLRGGFVLTGRALGTIARLCTTDGTPIRTEDDLVRFLTQLDLHKCATCHRSPVFCMVCFNNRPPQAQELVALARHRWAERRAQAQREGTELEAVRQARARSEYRESRRARRRREARAERPEADTFAKATPEPAEAQPDRPAQEGHEDQPRDQAGERSE